MKRTIVKAPVTFTEADLTPPQRAALSNIVCSWVIPMPGTVAVAGEHLIDGVMLDSFNPDNIAALGLPFTVLGIWQWDGAAPAVEALVALDEEAFGAFLPLVEGEPPAAIYEPHRWAGWPAAL
jgi:hypothetical protein